MSPRGRKLDQEIVTGIGGFCEIIVLCGHYEGVDQRIIDYWNMERNFCRRLYFDRRGLPAMILIDAVARMVPEVLGSSNAHHEESIYSGLLEYPQYNETTSV